jgi:hypothetical protein
MKYTTEIIRRSSISHASVLNIDGGKIDWLIIFDIPEGGIVSVCNDERGEDENYYTMYDPDGGPLLEIGNCLAQVMDEGGMKHAFIESMRMDKALNGLVVRTNTLSIFPIILLDIER